MTSGEEGTGVGDEGASSSFDGAGFEDVGLGGVGRGDAGVGALDPGAGEAAMAEDGSSAYAGADELRASNSIASTTIPMMATTAAPAPNGEPSTGGSADGIGFAIVRVGLAAVERLERTIFFAGIDLSLPNWWNPHRVEQIECPGRARV